MRVELGEVATYINGYAFKPSDWSDTGVPIIRIQDLTGNSYQANRYNGTYDKKYEVLPGDVLISWSASLGVYVWDGEPAVLNQHIFKVVFNKCPVDKSFFVHQVRSILMRAASAAHGATMKHLTTARARTPRSTVKARNTAAPVGERPRILRRTSTPTLTTTFC